LIDIGTEVEIAGVRGKIAEMTLTVTKVKTKDGRLMKCQIGSSGRMS